MSDVVSYLNQILEEAEKIGIVAKKHLNPGLSSESIEELVAVLPFSLPRDIAEFYRWHNGMRLDGQKCEFRLLPGKIFEPLEDAIQRTQALLSVAGDPSVRWSQTWYSLCTDLAGDYFAVEADANRSNVGTIMAINVANEPYPAFRSFRTMLLSMLDCFKLGGYLLDEDGFLVEESWLADLVYRLNNGGLSPNRLMDPNEIKMCARRAREIFRRENREDLLEKLVDLERRSA